MKKKLIFLYQRLDYEFKGICPNVYYIKMETIEQWSLSVENVVSSFHCSFKSRESSQYIPSWDGLYWRVAATIRQRKKLNLGCWGFFHSYLEAKEIVTAVFHYCISVFQLLCCLNFPLAGFRLPNKIYGFTKEKNQDIYRSLCIYTDAQPGVLPLNRTTKFSQGLRVRICAGGKEHLCSGKKLLRAGRETSKWNRAFRLINSKLCKLFVSSFLVLATTLLGNHFMTCIWCKSPFGTSRCQESGYPTILPGGINMVSQLGDKLFYRECSC